MPWQAAIMAAGSIVSGSLSANAAESGAERSAETQLQMFERGLEETAPYREFGKEAMPELGRYLTPEGQADIVSGFYESPLYRDMSQQAERSILRSQAATGGLRSGDAQSALAGIAPQLGQQYLSQNYDRLLGIGNIGVTTSGAASAQAGQTGRSVGETLRQGILGEGRAYSGMTEDLAAIGASAFGSGGMV